MQFPKPQTRCLQCERPTIYAFCDFCAPIPREAWEGVNNWRGDTRHKSDPVGKAPRESLGQKVMAYL